MKKIYISAMVWAGLVFTGKGQTVFPEIDTNYTTNTIIVPASPIKGQPIFVGMKDLVINKDGQKTLARQMHDFIGYTPINPESPNDSAYIIVNHETTEKNIILGNGGGMTVFKVRKTATGSWERYGDLRNVDFSEVGYTYANCGGICSSNGRIWTAEEWMSNNNKSENITKSFEDTTDWVIPQNANFGGTSIKRYQNFNWMVEVDPVQAKAVRKMYNWGRFGHEGGVVMKDNKTVYLTDDDSQAAFYKFIATTENNFNEGKLYVYQQSTDGESGNWIEIDNSNLDTLINIQSHALKKGATMFLRHEWPVEIDGKIYITETGSDKYDYRKAVKSGYRLAKHLWAFDTIKHPFSNSNPHDTTVVDPYGRVLVFDPATNKMSSFLEGGRASLYTQNKIHMSNPDGIGKLKVGEKTYMVIQEDLNGKDKGRVGNALVNDTAQFTIAEMFLLDMEVANPTLNDLKRFAITPKGTEVTGFAASPDGSVLFFNSQHPDTVVNTGDYKNSLTMMVTNLPEVITSLYQTPQFEGSVGLTVWPNPVAKELHFSEISDIAIYDTKGTRVKVARATNSLNISDLNPGVYYLQTLKGHVQKIIIE